MFLWGVIGNGLFLLFNRNYLFQSFEMNPVLLNACFSRSVRDVQRGLIDMTLRY